MKHIIDDLDKNKYEAYTKVETLAAIQEAISSGELPEEINGLVLTFKNPVDNQAYKIAFCTQAKYNELEAGGDLEENCIYYITDDTTLDDLNTTLDEIQSTLDWVVEKINTGLKNNITNVECAFDFTEWNNSSASYNKGVEIRDISLQTSTTGGAGNVNILPAGSNTSIALAKVEYVSGDSGYIDYQLQSISQNASYITFKAMNISNGFVYGPLADQYAITDKQTTFKLTIQDIYGFEFTKEFTINYKAV